MRRIEPYFPLSHGIARVDDRRVVSGIVLVIRNALRSRDAPHGYGRAKKTISTVSCAGAVSAGLRQDFRQRWPPQGRHSTRRLIDRHDSSESASNRRQRF